MTFSFRLSDGAVCSSAFRRFRIAERRNYKLGILDKDYVESSTIS